MVCFDGFQRVGRVALEMAALTLSLYAMSGETNSKSVCSLEQCDQTSFAALKPSRQMKGTVTERAEHPEKERGVLFRALQRKDLCVFA